MLKKKSSLILAAVALALFALGRVPARGEAQPITRDIYGQLEYRYVGPVGNRVTSVVGILGDPRVYYVGAASGGIWKTADGGAHWEPVFDDQPVSSLGSLAIAPSDPSIVWAGTGESFIRSHISLGAGIYKSVDAGKTWTLMGLERTGRIGRVVVHPHDPDVVFACALGHASGPQPERGVFRTIDGGKTWERVLFVDENTGCSEMAMDPNRASVLFAGMWQIEIHTWGRESGGPGSGLYMSSDGGTTWGRLTQGLPKTPVGRIAVAVARKNSNRIYALIETGDGVPWKGQDTESGTLWSSDDGGATWRRISHDHSYNGRAHYYSRFAVSPDDENELYFLTASFTVSLDGGQTSTVASGRASPGGDNHDMWIDPTNGDRMIVGNDGGTSISLTRGRSWTRIQLPIAQMYHVNVDNQIPYHLYGNRQDGPSARVPSNSRLSSGVIPRGEWHSVGGGESGWAIPDPVDPNIIWSSGTGSGAIGGVVHRFDERTRQYRHVEIWPESTVGWPAAELKYRFNWTFPVALSPHDRNTVYAGSQHVHRTTNGGESWEVLSPDLTLDDKSRQQISGGLTPDNIGVEYAGVIMAIAESPLEKGVIWAGTNDGLVHVTRDAGARWTNVAANIPNLPSWGTVYNIEPSRHTAGTAYVAFDFHQVNHRDPHIYKTTDYGRTWTNIASDIPKSVLSYVHAIKEDPVRPGLLYAGTENALYVSFNDGQNWLPLQNNLPHAPVYWITIQEHFNDLVVSTYGRGFWILDDITPLRQLTPEVLAAAAHLFPPRPAYRFRDITAPMAQSDDPTAGRSPPYGGAINYYLKSSPAGEVKISILDASGQAVRTLDGSKQPGINRIWWDLRYEPSREVRLRTSPLHAPWVTVGPEGWRPLPAAGGGRLAILAPPGTYTVKLSVAGQQLTHSLTVRKDPNSAGTEADVQAQMKMLFELRDNLETVAGMINQIEWVRKQLSELGGALAEDQSAAPVRTAAGELDKKFVVLEDNLFQMKLTGRGQDGVRWPAKLIDRLRNLASGLEQADFAPTDQQVEVHQLLKQQITTYRSQLSELVTRDLAEFNRTLRERNIANIVAGSP
ncbi:MAG: sialidase [Gemmatimonadetes bacterium]|nr:sialidase [Gemmatimonadota bacterium]